MMLGKNYWVLGLWKICSSQRVVKICILRQSQEMTKICRTLDGKGGQEFWQLMKVFPHISSESLDTINQKGQSLFLMMLKQNKVLCLIMLLHLLGQIFPFINLFQNNDLSSTICVVSVVLHHANTNYQHHLPCQSSQVWHFSSFLIVSSHPQLKTEQLISNG